MIFDFHELLRILAIVKRDGDAALSDEERKTYEAWRAFARSVQPTDEQIRVFEIIKSLPEDVARPFMDWTLAQTAVLWPLLREQLVERGVDVEVAEKGEE